MKFSLMIGLAFLTGLAACQSDAIPRPEGLPAPVDYRLHPRQTAYQRELDAFVQKNKLPGAVLLLKKPGQPLWAGAAGFSNLEHRTPMQVNAPFRVGSLAKTFVATLIMKLVEAGRLDLEAKLATLLPETKGKIVNAEQITLRQLLAHTSGIFDPTNDDVRYQLDMVNNPRKRYNLTPDQVLERHVYGRPAAFAPGERYSYSNPNYLLVGKIVERLTGKTLQTVLEEQISRPLGLRQTYIDKRDDRNVARGYADFYGNGQRMDVTALDRAEADGGAYGGLISTAEDLFRFSEALFGGKLVSQASLQQMMQPYPVRQGTTTYGLGVDTWPSAVAGTGFGNNGTLAGTEANLYYFPNRQTTFVILNNYGGGTHKDFLEKVMGED